MMSETCVLNRNVILQEERVTEVSSYENYAGTWTFTPLLLECLQRCSAS